MRQPDFVIGDPSAPYMLRWWIIPRNRWFNVYLHKILRDDDDRALHDHPWVNVSIVLRGAYREITPLGSFVRRAFSVVFRLPSSAHRLVLVDGPVWSLFITGPVVREWGFHCPRGWVPWREFVAADNAGAIGRGCGEGA
jgi:hypothetical protein